MIIRYMNASDNRLEISRIYEASWKYAYKNIVPQEYLDAIPEGKWVPVLDTPGWQTLICIDDGKYVGTSSFSKSRFDNYSECGEIISIYLLPEYMGKGYGKKLFETTVAELTRQGFKEIFLWTLEDNDIAKNFYKNRGFRQTEDYLDDNIGGKNLREVRFVCTIR